VRLETNSCRPLFLFVNLCNIRVLSSPLPRAASALDDYRPQRADDRIKNSTHRSDSSDIEKAISGSKTREK
jgi:hypothetical protein